MAARFHNLFIQLNHLTTGTNQCKHLVSSNVKNETGEFNIKIKTVKLLGSANKIVSIHRIIVLSAKENVLFESLE